MTLDKSNYDFSGSLVPQDYVVHHGSALFPARKTLRILYGIFVEVLRQLYSSESNLLAGAMLLWDPDPVKTKIWIDTEYIWEDNTPEFRPAIYVSIKGLTSTAVMGAQGKLSTDLTKGSTNYCKDVTGTVALVHIGRTKGETITLIDNTYEYLDGLSDIIKDDFCFRTFNVGGVTPLQVVKAESDHLRGEVMVQFTYHDMWSVNLESPKLKEIRLLSRQSRVNLVN